MSEPAPSSAIRPRDDLGKRRAPLSAGAAALAIACGALVAAPLAWGGVPADAIATVGNVPISRATFDHWLMVAQKSAVTATSPAARTAPLDPPGFTACVTFHQHHDPKPAKGRPRPTRPQVEARCQYDYDSARDQVVPFLITAQWIQGEAADQGVTVSDVAVAKILKTNEANAFPAAGQLRRFLARSGETNADLLLRVRLSALTAKLAAKAAGGKAAIAPADITAYYNQHISQFSRPERRDLRIVLVKTPAEARRVRTLVAAGQRISRVARRYSVDAATRAQGGALTGVVRGSQGKALEAAIFGAPVGRLVGPVKTAFGYEIFRVQKITPASSETAAQATPLIRRLITAQSRQAALTAFTYHFHAKWRGQTTCAVGYIVADCNNGPETRRPTTP